jgi:hypothetical protein
MHFSITISYFLRAFIVAFHYAVFEISGVTAVRDRATASQG